MIKVIGAGALNEKEGMSVKALKCIEASTKVIYQTDKQACYKESAKTLDGIFESAADFDEFAKSAAKYILENGDVFVAVGDGVNNSIVKELCALSDDVEILQGPACACVAAAAKDGAYAFNGLSYVGAYDYLSLEIQTDTDTVITDIDSELLFYDIKAKLLDYYSPDCTVYFNDKKTTVEKAEYSAPCDLFLPFLPLLEKKRYSYLNLMEIVKELRQKCPWDREQTHKSILTNLIEECYELYEALDKEDSEAIIEEMGDVLLQICLHNVFECEHGDIYSDDVTTVISKKLIRRHPHVYGELQLDTKEQVKGSWDEIKKQEYGLKTKADELKHVSSYLPALMRAYKVEKKAKKLGIEIEGNISDAIKNIESEKDIKENCSLLLLLAVKTILEAGEHPYICMNDGISKFISEVEKSEKS